MVFIRDFFNNPAGKGSTILNINATKSQFNARYNEIQERIHHKIYFVKKSIYFLINIPSSVNGIMYDIVVKFEPTPKSAGESITDMSMEMFSNSPSFLYTFANAYDKQKIFAKEFKRKLSSKMLKDIAKTKNPYGILSYDFSIYSALYYILSNDLTKISNLETFAIKTNLNEVIRSVKNADALQKDRKLQKDYNKMLEKEELDEKKDKIKHGKQEDNEQTIRDVPNAKSVKNNKSIKKTKSVAKIKRRH